MGFRDAEANPSRPLTVMEMRVHVGVRRDRAFARVPCPENPIRHLLSGCASGPLSLSISSPLPAVRRVRRRSFLSAPAGRSFLLRPPVLNIRSTTSLVRESTRTCTRVRIPVRPSTSGRAHVDTHAIIEDQRNAPSSYDYVCVYVVTSAVHRSSNIRT